MSSILQKKAILALQIKPTGMFRAIYLPFLFLFVLLQTGISQKPFLQVQATGGYSIPMKPISESNHFSENGWNAQGGFSMFFGKFGVMTAGGYQRLAASPGFESFVFDKYKEIYAGASGQYWQNAFGMIGPVYKWTFGRFDLDIFALIGMSKLSVPDLLYTKNFFGQNAEIARYYGKNDELIPFWSGGFTFHTRIYKGLSLIVEPTFLSNRYLSTTLTTFRYVNARDNNNNGYIDDVEFSEAEVKKQTEDVFFSNVNFNIGFSYQFGREEKKDDPVAMIPLENQDEKTAMESDAEKATNKATETSNQIDTTSNEAGNEKLVTGANPPDQASSVAPQTYDQAEAQFLYKAGELYYQNNDFENAVACFNKLKNNEAQHMSKYMFALSLCEMLNCDEAAKEYADFEKKYKADDSGVLYTVFKSQFEKCRKNVAEQEALVAQLADEEEKLTSSEVANNVAESGQDNLGKENKQQTSSNEKTQQTVPEKGTTFRIQFVALRISNKNFPRLENIGKITHEFYPQKSMYRYTLGPYTSQDEAVSDMLKVRVMGFDDAFLAEYKDGQRTNTLYHAQ